MEHKDIVVVVDGSEASLSAVRWAAWQSQITRDRLVVLHAFEVEPGTTDVVVRVATESVERTQATGWLRRALDESPAIPFSMRLEVIEGPLSRVLGRFAAPSTSLVVLGVGDDRGPNVDHLGVPVVRVPAEGHETTADRGDPGDRSISSASLTAALS